MYTKEYIQYSGEYVLGEDPEERTRTKKLTKRQKQRDGYITMKKS